MWQALRSELAPLGVEIVTVAMDTAGADAARPFVEAAQSEHPSLLDVEHRIGDLFGVINVPNSIWIDESGTIVRPVEPAFPNDQPRDGAKWQLTDEMPELMRDMLTEANKIKSDPVGYVARLRDWAANGADSAHALRPEQVLAASGQRTHAQSEAAAHFELAQHLWRDGHQDVAKPHFREARRLFPDNWTYKRQAWTFGHPMQGPSEGLEGSWLDDIKAIGAENYYPELVV